MVKVFARSSRLQKETDKKPEAFLEVKVKADKLHQELMETVKRL